MSDLPLTQSFPCSQTQFDALKAKAQASGLTFASSLASPSLVTGTVEGWGIKATWQYQPIVQSLEITLTKESLMDRFAKSPEEIMNALGLLITETT